MIISVVLLIFSFLFEGFISNYISSSLTDFNLFTSLYTLITLVVLYPYFHNKKKYYILLLIFSFLIDIVYTNTLIFNVILFVGVSFIYRFLNYLLSSNLLMINIISLVSVFFYHLLSYLILVLINYNNYPFMLLINIFLNSIIMTVIYTSIVYFVSKYLFDKFDIKQVK